VDEGGKVQLRPVQATSWLNSLWLIEGGLGEGEWVAVTGLQSILPGSPVKPVPYVPADLLGKAADTDTGGPR
jgi:membrane fusion protein, multidrug efflux system